MKDPSPSGWDRAQGLLAGVLFCGFTWAVFSYLPPLALGGQGWVAPGTGAWGGLILMGVGATGLVAVAVFRRLVGPRR